MGKESLMNAEHRRKVVFENSPLLRLYFDDAIDPKRKRIRIRRVINKKMRQMTSVLDEEEREGLVPEMVDFENVRNSNLNIINANFASINTARTFRLIFWLGSEIIHGDDTQLALDSIYARLSRGNLFDMSHYPESYEDENIQEKQKALVKSLLDKGRALSGYVASKHATNDRNDPKTGITIPNVYNDLINQIDFKGV